MRECDRLDCDRPGHAELTCTFEGLPKKLVLCKYHEQAFRKVWNSLPVDNSGFSVENPYPDPGKPGTGGKIVPQQPLDGP